MSQIYKVLAGLTTNTVSAAIAANAAKLQNEFRFGCGNAVPIEHLVGISKSFSTVNSIINRS